MDHIHMDQHHHHHHRHHCDNMSPATSNGHHHEHHSEHHPEHHPEHNGMNGMHMYFHQDPFTYLFKGWTSADAAGLAGALVLTVLLGVLLECVKVYLYSQHLSSASVTKHRSRLLSRTCHSCLYSLRVVIGYLLMLVAMTYNVWLITCTIIGSAIGYFFALPVVNGYFRRKLLKRYRSQSRPIYRREERDRLMRGSEEIPEVRNGSNTDSTEIKPPCCDGSPQCSSEETETVFTRAGVYRSSPMVTEIK